MPTKNAKRSTSFIRLLWPAAAANGTPVLALRMARTPHWAFGCKPDQKGASPSQALGGAGGLWRSLWLAGLLWSTARGSHAGRVQGASFAPSGGFGGRSPPSGGRGARAPRLLVLTFGLPWRVVRRVFCFQPLGLCHGDRECIACGERVE